MVSILMLLLAISSVVKAAWIMAPMGVPCNQACFNQGMNCNPATSPDALNLIQATGITCQGNPSNWFASDQPSYVSDPNSQYYGQCFGTNSQPAAVGCSGYYPSVSRLCNCEAPTVNKTVFGISESLGNQDSLSPSTWPERVLFSHVLALGDTGVMTHLYISMFDPAEEVQWVTINYYVDNETTPSISMVPAIAMGASYNLSQNPWGNKYFSKGAQQGAYNWDFKVPFQHSILITAVGITSNSISDLYYVIHGGTNLPISVGNVQIPSYARLTQSVQNNVTYPALAFVDFVNIPGGTNGVLFQHTMFASSATSGFIQGCFHLYYNPTDPFPGFVYAAGTEVYFDSAYLFNGGPYQFENSGLIYYVSNSNVTEMAAYKFHDQNPIYFTNGLIFQWRIGDMNDAGNNKCNVLTAANGGGYVVFNPTNTTITSYTWVYTW